MKYFSVLRLIKTIFLMGCLIQIMLASPVQAQDSTGNRIEAAQRYMKVSDIPKMLNDMAQQLAMNVPENKRQEFIQFMSGIDSQKLEQLMVVAVVQHFTVDEINALENFYGSPTGKSIMKKFPVYMASIGPSMEKLVIERAKKFPQ